MRIVASLLAFAALASGDVSHSGFRERLLLCVWRGDGAQLMLVAPSGGRALWKTPIGALQRAGHPYWTDMMFAATRKRVFIIDNSRRELAAYDLGSGRKLWTAEYPGADFAFVAAQGEERVYVSGYTSGATACYDAATGAKRWDSEARGMIACARSGVMVGSSFLDDSGKTRWSAAGVNWPILVTDQIAVCSNWSNLTVAYRISDGSELWRVNRNGWTGALEGGTLLIGGYWRHVTAVDLNSGKELWSYDDQQNANAYLVSAAGRNFALAASHSRNAVALDLRTGDVAHKVPPSGVSPLSYHGMIAGHDAAVFLREDRGVRAIRKGGGEAWNRGLPGQVSAVHFSGGVVVAAASDLYGLSPADGRELWRMPIQAEAVYAVSIR
jgi:outer membrane protein assembly factor BamB